MNTGYFELPKEAQEMFEWFCGQSVIGKRKEILERLMNLSLDYSKCQSPIEVIFNVAFDLIMSFMDKRYELQPQYEVITDKGKRYVLDFAFIQDDFKLAVECDGHEFHEKTKDQVEYGNQRDLDLKFNGFEVLHFSGTQIYENPMKCACDTKNYIAKKLKGSEYGELSETSQENA